MLFEEEAGANFFNLDVSGGRLRFTQLILD